MLNRAERAAAVNVVGRIVIDNNVFVGTRRVAMPDAEIGPYALVAAGSIVKRDVESGTVVGGNPARRICTLEEYTQRYSREDVHL